MYFSVDEMDYWYKIHGAGTPIVLLHGFTGSSSTWDRVVHALSGDFRLITIDMPGHGNTRGDVTKSMEACVQDLHRLFSHLGLNQFCLVGYSMGGRTALSYALTYQDHVAGLILESASPGLADQAAREARKASDNQLAERMERDGLEAFINYWENIPLFATQKALDWSVQQSIRRERLNQTPSGLANSLRGMGTGSQLPNWDKLGTLTIPVLLLAGELDTKFVAINEEMKRHIPDAELQVFPDTGHAIHIEKPTSFEQAVLAFAKSHTS